MSIENYLKSAQEIGQFDSEGTFTLDQAMALQKLRRYQISQPSEFSLALVASANASGADWIEIQTSPSGFRLEHDGRPIPHHHLVSLFSSLLVDNSGELAAVQELAYGLNALLWLVPRKVQVTCRDAEQLSVLQLDSKLLVVRKGEPLETYGKASRRTTIEIEGLGLGLPALARRLGKRPELDCLRARCSHATVTPLVDGAPLVCTMATSKALWVVRLGSPPVYPEGWPAPLLNLESPETALLAICPDSPSRLTVVVHGIDFQVPEPELPGVQAVVFSGGLRKDLSGTGIVGDARYSECVTRLRAATQDLLDLLSQRDLPEADRAIAALVLEKEGNRARERWEVERAERYLNAARQLRRRGGF